MNLRFLFGKSPLGGLLHFFIISFFRITHILIVGFKSVPNPVLVLINPGIGKENRIDLVCFLYVYDI